MGSDLKRPFNWIITICVLGCIVLISLYTYISLQAKPYLYAELSILPSRRAALLLGTTKYIAKGKENFFYRYRIDAAAKLWKSGKIKAIIVSGDNGTKHYDETTSMYRDLIRAGVPARYITRDYAGFRTLDSVVRAGLDFGLQNYIIISQKFHLERALFIARTKGQDVIGFVAEDTPQAAAANRMVLRELLARAKAFLDLYILDTKPKYFGGKEKVVYKP